MDSRAMGSVPDGPSGEKSTLCKANPCPPMLALVILTLRESRNVRTLLTRVRAALDRCDRAHKVIVVDNAGDEAIRFRVQFDLVLRCGDQKRAEGCN
jgi:hypothetical protein